MTRPIREKLLERYPYLAAVPEDAPDGADSPLPPPPPIDWCQLGVLVPLTPQEDGSKAQDELPNSEDGYSTTWHDVALSIGAEFMAQVRAEVLKQLGYTTSAVSGRLNAEKEQHLYYRLLGDCSQQISS